ncbi:hypothetical protein P3T34_006660 [Kitasatospora sp. MAP12-44]|uniref:hypothetical protein n=1 Tax=Kitasatospora sp. MAP12-44 TaxID=3035099 RepID=UPI00247344F8|nr:hypothetical protein [Kitasatospora sp. MAP12-44]MDH6114445.1 hypothetical protein [Kitasatospora sp. MAP12-44]
MQILLDEDDAGESLTVRLEAGPASDGAAAARAFLDGYPELGSAVEQEGLLALRVEVGPADGFERTAASGKLLSVVERRARNR